MKSHVNVLGVGMTQFKTPKNADPYTVMGVVNPSGDLFAKAHPLGATGLAQCAELNWHRATRSANARSKARVSPCSTTSASAGVAW